MPKEWIIVNENENAPKWTDNQLTANRLIVQFNRLIMLNHLIDDIIWNDGKLNYEPKRNKKSKPSRKKKNRLNGDSSQFRRWPCILLLWHFVVLSTCLNTLSVLPTHEHQAQTNAALTQISYYHRIFDTHRHSERATTIALNKCQSRKNKKKYQ